MRSLHLLREPNDPNPVKVYEHTHEKAVEVDVVTGKTVTLASVVAKTLPAGVYTIAKSGISYVRYSVSARMHTTLGNVGLAVAYHALSRKTDSDAALAKLIAEHDQDAPYNVAAVYAFRR